MSLTTNWIIKLFLQLERGHTATALNYLFAITANSDFAFREFSHPSSHFLLTTTLEERSRFSFLFYKERRSDSERRLREVGGDAQALRISRRQSQGCHLGCLICLHLSLDDGQNINRNLENALKSQWTFKWLYLRSVCYHEKPTKGHLSSTRACILVSESSRC